MRSRNDNARYRQKRTGKGAEGADRKEDTLHGVRSELKAEMLKKHQASGENEAKLPVKE